MNEGLLTFYRGKRVLVTGGTGFLGAHLVHQLHQAGAKIHIFDLHEPNAQPLLESIDHSIQYDRVDVRHYEELQTAVQRVQPQVIFHLAALLNRQRDYTHVDELIAVNVNGTANLLRALAPLDYEAFILTSSSEVYGEGHPVPLHEEMLPRPVSPYSASKLSAEIFCRTLSEMCRKPYTICRLFNLYGEGQEPYMFIPQLLQAYRDGRSFNMTGGKQAREFNYVGDVVDALLLTAASPGCRQETINIGCGEEVSLKELAEKINALLPQPVDIHFGALPYRENEVWRMFCDNSKARRLLGWQPVYSLDSGLKRVINLVSGIDSGSHT